MEKDLTTLDVNLKENICNTIDKWLTNNKEYSTSSFARELGVTDSSVNRWRKGICCPEITLFTSICKIMNISLNTFLGIEYQNGLNEDEKHLVAQYQNNAEFKSFINNYLNNDEFRTIVNSIAKLSK